VSLTPTVFADALAGEEQSGTVTDSKVTSLLQTDTRSVNVPLQRTFRSGQIAPQTSLRGIMRCAHLRVFFFACYAARNSREVSNRGVLLMVQALDQYGWMPNLSVAGMVATRAQLLAENFSEGEIQAQVDQLKEDLLQNRLKVEDSMTPLEKELLDPDADKFVLVFDGQHRSEPIARQRLVDAGLLQC
jgi:hypothetical protein